MMRARITIDHNVFYLAQGQDVDDVCRRIAEAARGGGDFVRFTEVGNRSVRVLVSPGVAVIVEEYQVDADARDDGDLSMPYMPDFPSRQSFVDFDLDYGGPAAG